MTDNLLTTADRVGSYIDKLQARITELESERDYLLDKVYEATGYVHATCCILLEKGSDPRDLDCSQLIEGLEKTVLKEYLKENTK